MQTTYMLHIYESLSGQFSGRLYDGDSEVLAVAGCATANEVRNAVLDAGYEDFKITMDVPN